MITRSSVVCELRTEVSAYTSSRQHLNNLEKLVEKVDVVLSLELNDFKSCSKHTGYTMRVRQSSLNLV